MTDSAATSDPALVAHRVAWVAAGLRRAARTFHVQLPASYSEAVASDGLGFCGQLGVTGLGQGVIIHTAPENDTQLPLLLGYADQTGQWYRDGQRHTTRGAARSGSVGREGIGL